MSDKQSFSSIFPRAICNIRFVNFNLAIGSLFAVPNSMADADAERELEFGIAQFGYDQYGAPHGTLSFPRLVTFIVSKEEDEESPTMTRIIFHDRDGNVLVDMGRDEFQAFREDSERAQREQGKQEVIIDISWGLEGTAKEFFYGLGIGTGTMSEKYRRLYFANKLKPIPLDENGDFVLDGYTSPSFSGNADDILEMIAELVAAKGREYEQEAILDSEPTTDTPEGP